MIGLFPVALAAIVSVSGVVFADANGNGRRDAGEAGLKGVVVTDGVTVVASDAGGAYRLPTVVAGQVFVVTPGDRRAVGGWYRTAEARVDFPLAPDAVGARWRFAHLSDPHVEASNAERFRAALVRTAAEGVDFAIVSGDLVYDALRADAATAAARFASYDAIASRSQVPLRPVIGNHDVFGIERALSHVALGADGYGKELYEEKEGPRYSAFDRGRIHFIVLDTIGIDDTRYFGFLDAPQLDWIRRELQHVAAGTTVVTVGHIPLRSGALALGYAAERLAHTLLRSPAPPSYQHVVRNADALAALLAPYRWTLALQGHTHVAERLAPAAGTLTRYQTAPAATARPEPGSPPGFFVYTVSGDAVDDGVLVTLAAAKGQGAGE
jgi:3',5'-cyclic-AMP phosphodiesterase